MHAQATIGFGFTSDWLKKWREISEPITEWSNHKPKQFAYYFRHSIENRSSLEFCKFVVTAVQKGNKHLLWFGVSLSPRLQRLETSIKNVIIIIGNQQI